MRPTADPQHLRQLAQKCREQAGRLDSAVSTLRSQVATTIASSWTGAAADSLGQVLDGEMQRTRRAADWLRAAAGEFDRGASEVDAYRAARAAEARKASELVGRELTRRGRA